MATQRQPGDFRIGDVVSPIAARGQKDRDKYAFTIETLRGPDEWGYWFHTSENPTGPWHDLEKGWDVLVPAPEASV